MCLHSKSTRQSGTQAREGGTKVMIHIGKFLILHPPFTTRCYMLDGSQLQLLLHFADIEQFSGLITVIHEHTIAGPPVLPAMYGSKRDL